MFSEVLQLQSLVVHYKIVILLIFLQTFNINANEKFVVVNTNRVVIDSKAALGKFE